MSEELDRHRQEIHDLIEADDVHSDTLRDYLLTLATKRSAAYVSDIVLSLDSHDLHVAHNALAGTTVEDTITIDLREFYLEHREDFP